MTTPDPEELSTGDDIQVRRSWTEGAPALHPRVASTSTAPWRRRTATGPRWTRRQEVEALEIDLGDGARMIAVAGNGFVRGRPARVANSNTENERSLAFPVTFGGFDYLIGGDLIGRDFGTRTRRWSARWVSSSSARAWSSTCCT